jgi:energy-converting hydrogenase Eha subunit A
MPGRRAPTILALGHHALVRRLLAVLGIVLALACIMTNQVSVSATGHGRQYAALRAMSQGGSMPGRRAPTILALGHHALVRRLVADLGVLFAHACNMHDQVSITATAPQT